MNSVPFWSIALSILTMLGAVATWTYNWSVTRFRSRLKSDLEILKLYAELHDPKALEHDVHYRALSDHIRETMRRAYGVREFRYRGILQGLGLTALGLVNFLVSPSLLNILVGWTGTVMGLGVIAFEIGRNQVRGWRDAN